MPLAGLDVERAYTASVFLQVIAALTPTVCVALLFWFAMRAIVNADRRERAAIARFEQEQKAAEVAASGENER